MNLEGLGWGDGKIKGWKWSKYSVFNVRISQKSYYYNIMSVLEAPHAHLLTP